MARLGRVRFLRCRSVLRGEAKDVLLRFIYRKEEIYKEGGYDVIYFDTFSEGYSELKDFFQHLPNLLAGPESRFSFFHGLGATSKYAAPPRSLTVN